MTSKRSRTFDVVAYDKTVVAKIGALRGKERASYEAAKSDLEAQGCRQGGYRLLGADGTPSSYCCKHLHRSLRLITTYEETDVIVVAIGNHDGDAFYADLASAFETSETGQRRDQKLPCCGDRGWVGGGE